MSPVPHPRVIYQYVLVIIFILSIGMRLKGKRPVSQEAFVRVQLGSEVGPHLVRWAEEPGVGYLKIKINRPGTH